MLYYNYRGKHHCQLAGRQQWAAYLEFIVSNLDSLKHKHMAKKRLKTRLRKSKDCDIQQLRTGGSPARSQESVWIAPQARYILPL